MILLKNGWIKRVFGFAEMLLQCIIFNYCIYEHLWRIQDNMWFERILIKRKLASNNARVRIEAVSALDAISDLAILRELAAADRDAAVRAAAVNRFADPEILLSLQHREADPQVLALIADRIDQLYGEQALQACAEDRECDAFDRIENLNTLIKVALLSNSPHLVLSAGARLTAVPDLWQQFLSKLEDDRLALELYQRNMPSPDSPVAMYLLNSAKSPALREAIAAGLRQRQAQQEAMIAVNALVGAIEAAADRGDAEEFENLCMQFRSIPQVDESLKTRFMAAKYRFARVRQQQLADREKELREHEVAGELLNQLKRLENSGNWKLIRQTCESWKRFELDKSRGAAEYAREFNLLAEKLLAHADAVQQAYNKAVHTAEKVFANYQQFLEAEEIPPQETRRELLTLLEESLADIDEVPTAFAELRERILEAERQLSRRARAVAQARDIARWEHYTLKLDLCAELEKLSVTPDENLFELAKKFRSLRERWNAVGAVPNEKFEELRDRYHNVCSAIQERLDAFFARHEAQQKEALATKEALLQEAENLSGSDDWSETSARLKELQNLWKSAGSAGANADRELFEKFHRACDSFFVRRNAVWEERKKSFLAAANRKKELCEAAENLEGKPFAQAKEEIAALREAWRNVPSAGKDDRILYTRFNRAIENIFASHREAGDEARRQSEIICTALAEVLARAESGNVPVKDVESDLQRIQERWEAQSIRPAKDVVRRYEAVYDKLQAELCNLHHKEAMYQLESAMQLEAVIDPGDDNDKLIDRLGRRLKVCGELEERLRECRIISGGGDLASELQTAITGNFGGSDYRLTIAELDEFLRRFVAVGQVPPDAREAVFDRFRTLYIKALNELQNNSNSAEKSE